jgi:hypothetical protein
MFYNNGEDLEYDSAVAPGANPEQIQAVFQGTKGMRVDPKSGDLILTLPGGSEVRQLKPQVYQQVGDKRVEIAGDYRLLEHERVAFTVSDYDRSHALVIDPRLTISRSFSAEKDDQATAIAVDANGNTFITGFTFSLNFPVSNNSQFLHPKRCGSFPFDPGFCGSLESDAFVAEMTSDGSIGFVTYNGVGSGNGIAVDSSGVYVTGQAIQPDSDVNDFPFDNDNGELFVQRLSLTGQFSSSGDDVGMGVAVSARQPWITGKTCGDGFPTTDGIVHQLNHCAVFVIHLDEAGNPMMSTVFGGIDNDDVGAAIATNGSNTAYVTGYTNSNVSFPSTTGADIDPQGDASILNPKGFVTEVESFGRIVRSLVFVAPDGFVRPYAIANDNRGEESMLLVLRPPRPSQAPSLWGQSPQHLAF